MLRIMEFEIQKIQDSKQKWEEARPLFRGMGIILLAVGTFFLVSGLYAGAKKYRRIGQWAPVNALLLDFKVMRQSCGRASNCYQAYFTFQYEVQGRRFISGAQSDHLGSYSSEMSDWIQYQQGSHQQIRYNPLQPQEITIDDLNVRSFREPMKLGGWGAGLILIGWLLRR
jgi:Protein of unknown function (DUF3592)